MLTAGKSLRAQKKTRHNRRVSFNLFQSLAMMMMVMTTVVVTLRVCRHNRTSQNHECNSSKK
jgi:hypothetical protein